MTTWESLGVFRDILINYYFGSAPMYYGSIVVFFILALMIAGLEFRLSILFSLPLVMAFTIDGVWGNAGYVGNIALLLVAIIYAYAIMELMT